MQPEFPREGRFLRTLRSAVRPAICGAALMGVLGIAGCSDVTTPGIVAVNAESQGWVILADYGPMSVGGPSCPAVSSCSTQIVAGQESCVCELDGLDVSAGGGYTPPPAPQLPPAPGWTWPDPEVFSGGGYPPPATGSPCDQNAVSGGCSWTASLVCPQGVTRGDSGTCFFSISPSNALDYITGWTFSGQHSVTSPSGYYASSWGGVLVESGTVTVHFQAKGSPAQVVSAIGVDPRSGWDWNGSKRSFATGSPGQLDNCITTYAGLTADVYGCSSSNPGVLINPGANAGFTTAAGSGPNAGLWYVKNPTTRMDLRTQLSKKYRSDASKNTVNGVTQVSQACAAAYSPNPVPTQNNYGINTTCFQVQDFSSLVSHTWSHEGQHLSLAQQEAGQAYNNIYAYWEPIVRNSQSAASFAANQVQNAMHSAVANQSNSIHTGGPISFSFWYHTGSGIWQWSTVTTPY